MMKTKKYYVIDSGTNTGKHFINNDSDSNQFEKENAICFDSENECKNFIQQKGWSRWAVAKMYEV